MGGSESTGPEGLTKHLAVSRTAGSCPGVYTRDVQDQVCICRKSLWPQGTLGAGQGGRARVRGQDRAFALLQGRRPCRWIEIDFGTCRLIGSTGGGTKEGVSKTSPGLLACHSGGG